MVLNDIAGEGRENLARRPAAGGSSVMAAAPVAGFRATAP